jgi:hypothetical protein
MVFCIFGQSTVNAINLWIFWTFLRLSIWMVAFQWDAPCSIWIHGSWVTGFLRFQPCFVHTLSHCQCSRICPKLPKSARRLLTWETLKCHQNLRFLFFSYIAEAIKHVLTVWIFNKTKSCMSFLLSKNNLCMWIWAYPLAENDFFLNVPHSCEYEIL